jgi:hypothetical protein
MRYLNANLSPGYVRHFVGKQSRHDIYLGLAHLARAILPGTHQRLTDVLLLPRAVGRYQQRHLSKRKPQEFTRGFQSPYP